jgi:two-component system phosphate regulon sensor histidine kinase PhoR
MARLLKQNLRFKLLIILVTSLFFGLVTVGSVLYYQFQSFLYDNVKESLKQSIELAEQSLDEQKVLLNDTTYLKKFVDEVSHISKCRLTIIDINGKVLADSELPTDQLTSVENHLHRPEVQQSLRNGYGFNIRHSATIGQDLLYTSKLLRLGNRDIGFLRFAIFAEETDRMLNTARLFFVSGGLLVLIISALLVTFLARKINRNLNEVIEKARDIAAGNLNVKIQVDSNDELKLLGNSLNEMASKISINLQESARERHDLNTVLSSINEGIIAIESNKKIIFFNDKALKLLNNATQDILGQFYYQVIRNQHLISLLNNFFEKPFLISDELQVDNKRTLEIVISPFTIEPHRRKGVVVVLRDISHYKKLEKIRRDFVANVSHEFKTPLAAIRGYAETLLDWALEDPNVNRKYVKKVVKQSELLENLVTDLLQLARIERLQNIELKAFDPIPVIQDVLNEYSEAAQNNRIAMHSDLQRDHNKVLGDPEMFRSIIANLIDNAIKYTPAEGEVRVSCQINAKFGTFSVRDNGIGIPQNEQERVFERFYRVDKGRSRAIGGTGLGLSIVKHLAELQQAEVWLQSEINKGSCFSVKFKLAES